MDKRDQQLFIDTVQSRVKHLVNKDLWQGVSLTRVHEWFRQFQKQECALLGACLLDNLMYRSRKQVLALFKAALTCDRALPVAADSDLYLIERLSQRADPGIRLVPVISLDLPPTKSGPYMLRLLARDLGLRENWMIWPERLPKAPESVHTVIAVDDFCGSGRQFCERFLNTAAFQAFRQSHPGCRILYVSCTAHADGIASIRDKAPYVEVVAGEVLTSQHHFFNGTSLEQYKDDGLKQELRQQHETISTGLGLGGSVGVFGFEAQALTYGFEHGTPNNSLPLLWHDVDGWVPLLDR